MTSSTKTMNATNQPELSDMSIEYQSLIPALKWNGYEFGWRKHGE